jgi:hypothetical protein
LVLQERVRLIVSATRTIGQNRSSNLIAKGMNGVFSYPWHSFFDKLYKYENSYVEE